MRFQPTETEDWDVYLVELDKFMIANSYKKYNQKIQSETFAYWRTFEDKYQVGVLVYDLRLITGRITLQLECMILGIDSRCDLSVSKKMTLVEFEFMAQKFNEQMRGYL